MKTITLNNLQDLFSIILTDDALVIKTANSLQDMASNIAIYNQHIQNFIKYLQYIISLETIELVSNDQIIIPNVTLYKTTESGEYLLDYEMLQICSQDLELNITDSGLINYDNYQLSLSIKEIQKSHAGSYIGAFYYYGSRTILLPLAMYEIINLVREHQKCAKSASDNFSYTAKIKRIADDNKNIIKLSGFSMLQDYVCYDDDEKNIISLQTYLDKHKNITIKPHFNNISQEVNYELLKKIESLHDVQSFYTIEHNSKTITISLNKKLCNLLQQIKDKPTLSKKEAKELLANPNLFYEAGELINIDNFCEDIIGFTIQDKDSSSGTGYEMSWCYPLPLEFIDSNGTEFVKQINSKPEMEMLQQEITEQNTKNSPYFVINTEDGEKVCPFNNTNLASVEKIMPIVNNEPTTATDTSYIILHNTNNDTIHISKKYQIIVARAIHNLIKANNGHYAGLEYDIDSAYITNSEKIDNKLFMNKILVNANNLQTLFEGLRYGFLFDEKESQHITQQCLENEQLNSVPILPHSLKQDIILQQHQKDGITWLQNCYMLKNKGYNYKGVLLADDMGLGKTLQVLTFIEHLIFSQLITKPILIVAPIVLLNNWKDEYSKYFNSNVKLEILHGKKTLQKYAYNSQSKSETKNIALQENTVIKNLDTEKLRQNQVIITNYDTLVNYPFSLCSIDWSIVILDEAQNIKGLSSSQSKYAKSLKADFRIAMTGTPVENSLVDLWSLLEFLKIYVAPCVKEFKKKFDDQNANKNSLDQLKAQLFFEKPYAYLLRRDKNTLIKNKQLSLPSKISKNHPAVYEKSRSHDQSHDFKQLKAEMASKRQNSLTCLRNISILHQAYPIYRSEHDSTYWLKDFKSNDKTKKLKSILQDIRNRKEKVLIFAVSRKVQQLLKQFIEQEFQNSVSIFNGETKFKDRTSIIELWKNSNQEFALILSPQVAGVGLTLIEANHIIHYGRWWNPAVENQATDRVYRIGQKKDVLVHYINYQHTSIKSFDENLNELLEKKEKLALDFLQPYTDYEQQLMKLVQE